MNKLKKMINECYKEKPFERIVVIGIGSSKVIYDTFGPFTVSLLEQYFIYSEKKCKFELFLYGNLESPIHAVNYDKKINEIEEIHKDKNVLYIVLDACKTLRNQKENAIKIKIKPTTPGKGVGKNLRSIGDISIHHIIRNETNLIYEAMPLDETYISSKKAADLLFNALVEI